MQATPPPPDDAEPGQGGGGGASVDWDAAWQTELAKRKKGKTTWRPEGREPVGREELYQARGKRVVDDTLVSLQRASRSWQFWIGIIAAVSFLTAAVTQEPPSDASYTV